MKKVLVIGAGGIGSYLCQELHQLRHQWIGKAKFTYIDDDQVEEKNIKYQNYVDEDILDFKTDSLKTRYRVNNIVGKVTSNKDLTGYDLIILAVDNNQVRCLAAKYCFKNKVQMIDLRSEGRTIMAMTHSVNETDYWGFTEDDGGEGASCQLKFELEQGIIQNGNKIVAAIGAQYFLNLLRGDDCPGFFLHKF